MAVILSTVGKTLAGMLVRALTGKALEELIIYAIKYGAKATKATWDDELVEIITKHLASKKNG